MKPTAGTDFRRVKAMKTSRLLALVAATWCLGGPAARAAEPARAFEVEVIKDVAYYAGKGSDPVKHRLDLFLPKGHKDAPVLVFVHGGGWMIGDKSFFGRYSEFGAAFARQGIATVLPNYRLSPAVQHPEHVKDVARAVAWTVKNIGKYGGRADRLFLSGHSAGGHLVSLLATDDRYLKAEGLDLGVVKGVAAISGVYLIPPKNLNVSFQLEHANFSISVNNLDIPLDPFKPVFGEDPKARREASPLTHVRAGLPPFRLFYAEKDLPTLDGMARQFGAALKDAGDDV
jgi:acetyl esterase/lipase